MKSAFIGKLLGEHAGRTPRGVRGLKYLRAALYRRRVESHPARGAWIEIPAHAPAVALDGSHPARGAWIEIQRCTVLRDTPASHPARGAWIEIEDKGRYRRRGSVAPREGCGD